MSLFIESRWNRKQQSKFGAGRADMLSRQWSAKFAWFSRRVVGRKFCDPLVNFFAGLEPIAWLEREI